MLSTDNRVWSIGGMVLTQEKTKVFREKTCPNVSLPTIKAAWTELTLNSLSWEFMRCLDH